MGSLCDDGQAGGQRSRQRLNYERVQFLRQIEREHSRAMYGWHNPENIAWAAARATATAVTQTFRAGGGCADVAQTSPITFLVRPSHHHDLEVEAMSSYTVAPAGRIECEIVAASIGEVKRGQN